jgi:hypothetical protein
MGKWIVLSAALLVAACSGGDGDPGAEAEPIEPSSTSEEPAPSSSSSGALCADVIDASAELAADGSYAFSVTVRSADTGWEKYADAWEIRSPDGAILGTRVLTHPHETEQPFTRSLDSVSVPEGVDTVVIAARDSVEGFCGEQYRLSL